MADDKEETADVPKLTEKSQFASWYRHIVALAYAKGMEVNMFDDDGADDSYENDLDDDEQKSWDKIMRKLYGIIYCRIGDTALAKVWSDAFEKSQDANDTYHYALYHCMEALRAECVEDDTIGKDAVRTQFELALQSFNLDEGFGRWRLPGIGNTAT